MFDPIRNRIFSQKKLDEEKNLQKEKQEQALKLENQKYINLIYRDTINNVPTTNQYGNVSRNLNLHRDIYNLLRKNPKIKLDEKTYYRVIDMAYSFGVNLENINKLIQLNSDSFKIDDIYYCKEDETFYLIYLKIRDFEDQKQLDIQKKIGDGFIHAIYRKVNKRINSTQFNHFNYVRETLIEVLNPYFLKYNKDITNMEIKYTFIQVQGLDIYIPPQEEYEKLYDISIDNCKYVYRQSEGNIQYSINIPLERFKQYPNFLKQLSLQKK